MSTASFVPGAPSSVVLRPNQLPRYERGGGAATTPLVSRQIGATGFINGITEFAPGAAVDFHSHNCEESVVVLEGDAILEVDGSEHRLQAFDTTWLPPNLVHRFRNASLERPMKILWIYASMEATRTLAQTGETRPIAVEHSAKK